MQVVVPAGGLVLQRRECGEVELDEVVREEVGYTFALASELAVRATLVSLGVDDHVLVVLFHHIATDGESMRPFVRDLSVAYEARLSGGVPDWAPLPVQYADYALWQRQVPGSEEDPDSELSGQLAFWREALADLPVELEYPTDRPRPAVASQRGGGFEVELGVELHARLDELARTTGTTFPRRRRAAPGDRGEGRLPRRTRRVARGRRAAWTRVHSRRSEGVAGDRGAGRARPCRPRQSARWSGRGRAHVPGAGLRRPVQPPGLVLLRSL
ncbi:hypothetical protein FEF34_08760 [Streptomyces marianii]|uniref:Condensation domain-containing protein n=1 Tax=Streptomyces marianii TaxID=1817406 RepID=A0A5R9E0K6_9ACTN|nr:hypothetical protein FEF34_08760 [Streptomyces marianii]